jgi:hypothetical protein
MTSKRASSSRTPTRSRSSRFSRETDLSRLSETREELRSVLIVTNGESTEVDYFTGVKSESWISVGKVIVKFENGEPSAVVARAAALRDENDYDEAWAVCDLDEYDVTSAIAGAATRHVDLTLSVPSFEVWLILHLSESCPAFNNAKQASRFLKKILPAWNKTALRFADFEAGVADAVTRSKQRGEPPDVNPSTAVWRLIESLSKTADELAESS